tara:strand:+ start:1216 stop:1395 length:180 start_codon:yes stop_codon:yes gene_type:complete
LITENVAALYINPVSKKPIFNESANPLPKVVLPEAVGPSIAMERDKFIVDSSEAVIFFP